MCYPSFAFGGLLAVLSPPNFARRQGITLLSFSKKDFGKNPSDRVPEAWGESTSNASLERFACGMLLKLCTLLPWD